MNTWVISMRVFFNEQWKEGKILYYQKEYYNSITCSVQRCKTVKADLNSVRNKLQNTKNQTTNHLFKFEKKPVYETWMLQPNAVLKVSTTLSKYRPYKKANILICSHQVCLCYKFKENLYREAKIVPTIKMKVIVEFHI